MDGADPDQDDFPWGRDANAASRRFDSGVGKKCEFAVGTNLWGDIYTISTVANLDRITAVRLEALPDASLPNKGPGRHSTGNFQLSAFRLFQQTTAGVNTRTPLPVDDAWASFDYKAADADIAGTIDPSLRKFWHVWGRLGEAHQAVFHLQQPAAIRGRPFVIELYHRFTGEALDLGRFRLSVTGDDRALEVERLRNELKDSEVADLNVALAEAHAQQGHTDEAVASFTEAIHLTADRAGKARIVAQAAPLKGVLEKLAGRAAGDGQLQGDLARHFAAQGQAALAEATRTKARAWFEERLTKEPDNAALAAELADLLLLDTTPWTVLKPVEMKSNSGVTLTLKEDRSILVSGKYAAKDAYSLDFRDIPQGFRAIRLERLRDDTLPNGGPGTHGGGNFVLSEFRVFSLDDKQASGLNQILLRSACATFEEAAAQQSLDAVPGGGWSISGGQHQSQTAYFSVGGDAKIPASNRVRFLLDFSHIAGGGEPATLGRFRLSVSADAAAFDRERERLAVMKAPDPWVQLGAAYRDPRRPAGARQTPQASPGGGCRHRRSVRGRWGLGAGHRRISQVGCRPAGRRRLVDQTRHGLPVAGRTREGIPYLAKASAADPKDTVLSLKVAALQAWFGQDKELAATRQRVLAFAKDADEWPITPNAPPRFTVSFRPPTRRNSKRRWPSVARG